MCRDIRLILYLIVPKIYKRILLRIDEFRQFDHTLYKTYKQSLPIVNTLIGHFPKIIFTFAENL